MLLFEISGICAGYNKGVFLHHHVPVFKAWLRAEYLYDQESHHGEFERVLVLGVTSRTGRALGFTVVTEGGAMFMHLPISALVHDQDAPPLPFHVLQLWDCFSFDVGVIDYHWLGRCRTLLKDGQWYEGAYCFTLDWADCDRSRVETNFAEVPEEHKCGHFIALDNGCYALQPNNRVLWEDPAFITAPLKEKPAYKTNTHEYTCEAYGKWVTSEDARYFYETTSS